MGLTTPPQIDYINHVTTLSVISLTGYQCRVKPVYKGHPWDSEKVVVVQRLRQRCSVYSYCYQIWKIGAQAGRCRQVAVVQRWSLTQVWLYTISNTCFLTGGAVGDCITDQFTITAPANQGTPTICGFNTGQHSKQSLPNWFKPV